MAHRYWGINQGDQQEAVVEQASSPSKNVEVNVDLSIGMSREDVLISLDQIRNIIIKDPWPPA